MKAALLDAIRSELKSRFDRLSKSALETRAAATDPDSKAESKYDTRSLEASYLAAGQTKQVRELAEAILQFEQLELPDFDMSDEIAFGALVEVELNGETQCFLLVPAAGGMTVSHEGREITLLTPESPLHGKLLGLRVGDTLENPSLMVTELG